MQTTTKTRVTLFNGPSGPERMKDGGYTDDTARLMSHQVESIYTTALALAKHCEGFEPYQAPVHEAVHLAAIVTELRSRIAAMRADISVDYL